MNNNYELYIDKECSVCSSFGNKVLSNSNDVNLKSVDELDSSFSNVNSIILLKDKSIFIGMDAIVQVVGSWGGYYECIKIFKLFPKFINHCIYRFIATNRHRFSKVWVLLKRA